MDHESLSQSLTRLLESKEGADIPIADLFERVGEKGVGLLLIVMALPSALPVPAPGYSTPFGIVLAFLGIQMVLGKTTPWLPQWTLKKKINHKLATTMGKVAISFFSKVEHLIKPRFTWIGNRPGLTFLGILIILMASLMILPIPLTNTAPAMVIFLIGVGITEEDGLFAAAACLAGVFATAFYAYVIYLFFTVGVDGIILLKQHIKDFLIH